MKGIWEAVLQVMFGTVEYEVELAENGDFQVTALSHFSDVRHCFGLCRESNPTKEH